MQTIQLTITEQDRHIAGLATLAISIHLLESALPSPLPGVKPGFANIVVLFILYRYDFMTAASVSLLRVIAGSMLFGQLFTPTFFLSLIGAITSLSALSLLRVLPARYFGPVSLSVLAAMAHVFGQICLVRLWLIPVPQTFLLLAPLWVTSIIFGLINGLLVSWLLEATDHF